MIRGEEASSKWKYASTASFSLKKEELSSSSINKRILFPERLESIKYSNCKKVSLYGLPFFTRLKEECPKLWTFKT